jgi:hypothetical protein
VDAWHSTVASHDSEFNGFGGGLTRRAKTRPKGTVHAVGLGGALSAAS